MESDLWTPEAEAMALAECENFRNTPHMQRRAIPGRGVDCVQFVVAVVQAAGILPPFTWPQYRQDIGFRINRNQLGDLMREAFHAEAFAAEDWEPRTGDVGIFRCGRTSNHCGIFVAGRFWHVTVTTPVHDCNVGVVRGSLQEVVRFTATGLRGEPETLKTT
jgi:cell wall-associated NlpC family hydrolase